MGRPVGHIIRREYLNKLAGRILEVHLHRYDALALDDAFVEFSVIATDLTISPPSFKVIVPCHVPSAAWLRTASCSACPGTVDVAQKVPRAALPLAHSKLLGASRGQERAALAMRLSSVIAAPEFGFSGAASNRLRLPVGLRDGATMQRL